MIDAGLCATCRHGRAIRSDRGSAFWLCGRSATDPRFSRYPALPVRSCAGYEPTGSTRTGAALPAHEDRPPSSG